MNLLEEKIFEVISKPHLAGFSTITKNNKPWVRYVMAYGSEDFTIRFSTILNMRKVDQIIKNPEVHMNCGITNLVDLYPYLQIVGRATVVDSQEEKSNFWDSELLNIFEGPEDPNYVVIVVKPYYIEYNLPKNPAPPEIWIRE
ncbi:MAG: pyridoxamine 5'-phosphate oxidase family protein [bacterium]|nr:pyridoxamine 5'-phosphate oxidase family protein [bacterium]